MECLRSCWTMGNTPLIKLIIICTGGWQVWCEGTHETGPHWHEEHLRLLPHPSHTVWTGLGREDVWVKFAEQLCHFVIFPTHQFDCGHVCAWKAAGFSYYHPCAFYYAFHLSQHDHVHNNSTGSGTQWAKLCTAAVAGLICANPHTHFGRH